MKVIYAAINPDFVQIITKEGINKTYPSGTANYKKIVEIFPKVCAEGEAEFEEASSNIQEIFKSFTKEQNIEFNSLVLDLAKDINLNKIKESLEKVDLNMISSFIEETYSSMKKTLCAVIDGKPIPFMEKILPYFSYAHRNNSEESIKNFLKRVSNLSICQIEQLFEFLAKGDLPLAKDGTIIAYKILDKKGDTFFDCYSGKIPQQIGTYVSIHKDLTDPDPSHECSSGLHIARRSYLPNFNGDTCVLVRVKPEDIIAVPHNDFNKMRVYGYLIIAELSEEEYRLVKNNKPITDCSSGSKLLNFAYSSPWKVYSTSYQKTKETIVFEKTDKTLPKNKSKKKMEIVTPLEEEPKIETDSAYKALTTKERLRYFFNHLNPENAREMITLVKKSKRSLRSFGFSEGEVILIYHQAKQ